MNHIWLLICEIGVIICIWFGIIIFGIGIVARCSWSVEAICNYNYKFIFLIHFIITISIVSDKIPFIGDRSDGIVDGGVFGLCGDDGGEFGSVGVVAFECAVI